MSSHRLSAILAAVVCAAFLMLPAAQLSAEPITYYLQDYAIDQGRHISGTIITDGFLGRFYPNINEYEHIVSWTLAIEDFNGGEAHTAFFYRDESGPHCDGGLSGELVASDTDLRVPPTSDFSLNVNFHNWFGNFDEIGYSTSEQRYYGAGVNYFQPWGYVWDTGSCPTSQVATNNWIVATTRVPEPATLSLLGAVLLGVGGFLLVVRRPRPTP
jgi:hypothetical protein